jgi:hypothetical protein
MSSNLNSYLAQNRVAIIDESASNKGILKADSHNIFLWVATKISISLFIGAILIAPLLKVINRESPAINLFENSLNQHYAQQTFHSQPSTATSSAKPKKPSDTKQGISLPSVKETQERIKAYWSIVDSLRSEGTLSNEDIQAQGFKINPLTDPRFQKSQEGINDMGYQNGLFSSSPTTNYNRQVAHPRNRGHITQITHPYKKGLFVKGEPRKYPHNRVEKYYFSMDTITRNHLLDIAGSLPTSTSVAQAKALLGSPSKETFVRDSYHNRSQKLQKVLVYNLKQYRAGKVTPDKDQELILTFNEQNLLEDIYTTNNFTLGG